MVNTNTRGIGRALIAQVQRALGDQAMLLLLAAPEAMAYYPHVGFEQAHNAWIIQREN
jgi:predicted N-acetyltransferase YhbS